MKIRRIAQILSLLVVAGLCAQTSLAQGMMRAPGSGNSPGTSGPRAGEGVANPGAKTTGQSGGSGMMRAPGSGSSSGTSGPRAGEGVANPGAKTTGQSGGSSMIRAPGSGSSSGTSGPRAGEGAANLGGTSRTFHTPGGTITPGTEGTGQKPRGQDITLPGEKKGSAEPTKGTAKGPSTFTTPGGKITPGTEGTGQKHRGQEITAPGEKKGGTSAGTKGILKGPSTFTTPGGNIKPESQGAGQKLHGETIRPTSDEKVRIKAGVPSRGVLIGAPPTVIQKGEPGAAQVTPGLTPRAISVPVLGVPTGVPAPTGTSAPATGVSAPSTPVIEVPKVPSIDVQ